MIEIIGKHLNEVDGVVFDFGGVIAHAPSDDCPLYSLLEKVGIGADVVKEYNKKLRHLPDGGAMSMRDFYARLLESKGIPEPHDGFLDEVVAVDSEGWTHFIPETFQVMKELKSAGKKLGLLTNMSEVFETEYFNRLGAHILAMMDAKVISWRERLAKPDPAIYSLMAKRIQIAPERLLFLDDTLANVEGARRCGWKAEVFKA